MVVLLGCGLLEVAARRAARPAARPDRPVPAILPWAATPAVNTGGLGLLSYGGGFVIVPLMQADAVDRIHWMRGPY